MLLVWASCETSDPHVVREINCVGKDILSLHASHSGSFVFCGSIAGFIVLDALSSETLAVGSVDEGVTDVVEVRRGEGLASSFYADSGTRSRVQGSGTHHSRGDTTGVGGSTRNVEVWCIHGNSVLPTSWSGKRGRGGANRKQGCP